MRTAFSLIVLSMFCNRAFAQAPDSMLLSIMPIQWSYEFMSYYAHYPNIDSCIYDWYGSVDVADSGSISKNGNTYSIGFPASEVVVTLNFTLDTINDSISLSFEYVNLAGDEDGKISLNSHYIKSQGGKIWASNSCCLSSWEGYSRCGYATSIREQHGWISVGALAERVSSNPDPQRPFFHCASKANEIVLSFLKRFETTSIRIFDLHGRERDAIQIVPGSESLKYDASHLTPGMYLATLGGSAVKFIVR